MNLFDKSFLVSSFDDLSTNDLYQIIQLRCEVFVLEQNCPYQDLDDLDQQALHLYKKADSGQVVAYARILSPAQCENKNCSIGRVVVSQDKRHKKTGYILMKTAIEICSKQFPNHQIMISAQTYLTQFYQQLNFINTGHFYLEDQIPHQQMVYQPNHEKESF